MIAKRSTYAMQSTTDIVTLYSSYIWEKTITIATVAKNPIIKKSSENRSKFWIWSFKGSNYWFNF